MAAIIDVKTDLSMKALVTIARNTRGDTKLSQDYSVANVAVGAGLLPHCPLTPSDALAAVPGAKPGVTILPFRYFYFWGNLPPQRPRTIQYSTLIPHGSRARHSSDGRRSQSCGTLQILQTHAHCVTATVDLLIHGYFHTLACSTLAVYTSSCR